jgi:peptidoglycan/LPS O-acetylase OafA/YrhL
MIGFLITTLLRLEQEQHGAIRLREFYLRRALRIWPPFYTILLLAALGTAVGLVVGRLLPAPLLAQALHFNNYWTIFRGTDGIPLGAGVYWSLAIEEHFYLLFPWVFRALHRGFHEARPRALVLWGLCAIILAWRCALVFGLRVPEDRTYMGSDTRFDSILFGCALALWRNPVLDASAFAERTWKRVLFPAALALLAFTFLYRSPGFRETFRYTLQGIGLVPVFVVAIRHPDWGPMRLLNTRPMRFIGVLSYSLYLLHHVVLGVFHLRTALHPMAQGALALGVCVAVAWAIHAVIEKPAARLRRRLSRAVIAGGAST